MHIAEASHYYDRTGAPVYQVKANSGEMRPTTLRDARKFGLVPSVTTVMSILAKPQLERWKIQQAILASLTLPRPEGMSEDDWLSAIIDDSRRQGVEAADLGTKVHAQIQGMYEGELWEPQYTEYCEAVSNAMYKEFGAKKWLAEQSFAHPLNYGGKVDLASEDKLIVCDFKTSSMNGDKLLKAGYEEHKIQLAAYRLGLGYEKATLANTYISTSKPGEVFIKIYSEEEALQATNQWLAILACWKALKNFGIG